jgi:aminomethyltransferase
VRDVSDSYALLAVQGPRTLERLCLPEAHAFTFAEGEIGGVPCMVNRTGYTGEVGVELLCEADDAPALWDAVVERGAVPCGLGARDTLRLEVCYPLNGNDIGPDTDPVSAGLAWTCALDKDFTGAEIIRRIRAEGPERRLVPFVMVDKAVPRAGMAIEGGGTVTSGTHSPMLDRGIGMGYVPSAQAQPGEQLTIDVRGKPRDARVVRKPIYKKGDTNLRQPRATRRTCATTASTTGRVWKATRRRSASRGSPPMRSATSSTSRRPRRARA